MSKQSILFLVFIGLLSACGEETRQIESPPAIPQPARSHPALGGSATSAAGAQSLALATLEVEGYPDRTAVIEVLVRKTAGGCEIVKQHERIAADKKWSPLPLVIYAKRNGGPLSPVFDETLDFPDEYKKVRAEGAEMLVEFVRHRVFRALVRAEIRPQTVGGTTSCTAQLTICPRPRSRVGTYTCDRDWRELKRLVVVVDVRKHLASLGRPERERDDVVKMNLHTRRLDGAGRGEGPVVAETFDDFSPR